VKNEKQQLKTQSDGVSFLELYKFCPKCGGAMESKEHDESVMPTCVDAKCGYIFWQNSSPCVVTIMQNDKGLVLMTERGIDPDKGKLDLPGGFVKWGEPPAEAAVRETREEIGVEVELVDLVGLEIDDYWYQGLWEKTLTVGYIARIIKGEPHVADANEVASITWIDPDNFKPEQMAFSCNEVFLREIAKTPQYING